MEMGYEKNDRTTIADYLVSITDEASRKIRPGFEERVPRTVEELVAYWEASEDCEAMRKDVDRYEYVFSSTEQ